MYWGWLTVGDPGAADAVIVRGAQLLAADVRDEFPSIIAREVISTSRPAFVVTLHWNLQKSIQTTSDRGKTNKRNIMIQ